jgi:PIN domain nuclease of toxin-antitoxin system
VNVLLDTQVYLWYLADSPKLSRPARLLIARADKVYVSASSIWEASIKAGLGKLQVAPEDLAAGIEGSGFEELPVLARHAILVAALPPHHRDPFDRLLIAQAMHGPLHLLSADDELRAYSPLVRTV